MSEKETAMKIKMLRKILKDEFGIKTDGELAEALKLSSGVDIGIFTKIEEEVLCFCPELTVS